MIIELAFHDIDTKEIELKNLIIQAAKYQPDAISVYAHYIKLAKKILRDNIEISCPIDYPLGKSDLQTRQTEIICAINNGASRVDVVIPTLYLVNSKYEKFREDIKINTDLCSHHKIDIRYMLEYRIFNHTTLTKISSILKNLASPPYIVLPAIC
jgi:deoxyribose-phosphate aldolase